ncbi:uncharacterized protein LOC111870980 isoform X2 [Cryptotermes secundus]|uniref:uncharacterized protein LOC111870980 isoform X2 n=1 Tax=Cryptotermes secundus TaxID=105785 RepID=UPI000CD7B659|nr:uncharacterized protein LOC111870980 isoform X2 [Cryptotermes secundus]
MSGNEEFPLSQTLTDINSIYRSILVENEYLKNEKEYLKTLNNEYDVVKNGIIYLEDLKKEKISKEVLIDDSIESGRNTQLLLKEHKSSLLKELEVEQNRTAEQKKNHDFIISKYEATWERYKEIYSKLPFSRERKKLQLEYKTKHIQLMQFKVQIAEIKQKCRLLEQVREQRKKLQIVKLAEAYKDRETFSKRNAAMIQEIRRLRDEVEAKNIEKLRLMNLKDKDRTERYLTRDILSTPPSNFVIDIPCFSIPQLKLPPWYSPPRKIPCHDQKSRNTMTSAAVTDPPVASHNVSHIMARDMRSTSNPRSGLQTGKQNSCEETNPSLATPMAVNQDSSTAEDTEKDKQEELQAVTDSTAMDENNTEIHPCQSSLPAFEGIPAVATVQPEQKSGQSQWSPEEAMDQTPTFTSTEGQTAQQHSRQADPFPIETSPASSTQQTVAHATEAVGIRAGGNILELNVQTTDAGPTVGPRGDYQESPVHTVEQQVSAPQAYTMNTVESGSTTSQAEPTTTTEDDNEIDMTADKECYRSPITGENLQGTDQTSEADQHHDHFCCIASPEDECCALSPQGDFLMTSPDGTVSPKSPPFVISSSFQTANDVLFGARSNQKSNTGFTFNFGASNTGGAHTNQGADRGNPTEAFQFDFNKKTPSRSFFQLF